MLAGRAESLDLRVFKAERVSHLWGDLPIVFRLCTLPFMALYVGAQVRQNTPVAFVHLGTTGEQLTLSNSTELQTPTDPTDMTVAAYAAESILMRGSNASSLKHHLVGLLLVLQTVVWCLQGESVHLVQLGDSGCEIPDWSWELQQQGPRITNIRILSFDEPSVDER